MAIFLSTSGERMNGQLQLHFYKVSPEGFKSGRTDDTSFSNVCALADASSCKAANKSTI